MLCFPSILFVALWGPKTEQALADLEESVSQREATLRESERTVGEDKSKKVRAPVRLTPTNLEACNGLLKWSAL